MSKFVLDIGSEWKHNDNCKLCSTIDKLYNELLTDQSNQHKISSLEYLLIDGYKLINVIESNNNITNEVAENIKSYLTYNDDIVNKAISKFGNSSESIVYNTYFAKNPTMLFGRWCRDCGSRKPDIYDTIKLLSFNINFNYKLINNVISLYWDKLIYDFDYKINIYKKVDNIDEILFFTSDNSILTITDSDIKDGRTYYYRIEYITEFNEILCECSLNVLNKINKDHTPKQLSNLRFVKHKKIELIDDKYITINYIKAVYDKPDDINFGKSIFKLNSDHVPSIEFWHSDYEFNDDNTFIFPDNNTKYFIKTFVRSKPFKIDWINDHKIYPDKYFYNSDMTPRIIQYNDYRDDLYDLVFSDSRRSMKITYKLKIYNECTGVKLLFKQDNKFILDDNDGTYKEVIIPVEHAIYDYEVYINGLASNSFWVFGIFPMYENCDPDIKIENQTITKITPWFEQNKNYDIDNFYYYGKWYKNNDFSKYNMDTIDKIINSDSRKSEVLICDKIKQSDVSVALIHDDDVSECIHISFDYKMIAKSKNDVYNVFLDNELKHTTNNTYGKWVNFSYDANGLDYLILRWEQMKFSSSNYTCTFLDNVSIENKEIIDTSINNFTVDEEIIFKNIYYYNRKIKHNRVYQHTPTKCLKTVITINKYYTANTEVSK